MKRKRMKDELNTLYDEYISYLTKEEKHALLILLIMKFIKLFDKGEKYK